MNAYKTAITRKTISVPMRNLHNTGKLVHPYLDYGCGKGFDAIEFGMDRFDPHFTDGRVVTTNGRAWAIEQCQSYYETITCNYVLNVIESEAERRRVLKEINSMLMDGGIAYITVRRDIKKEGYTSKGTYQENIVLDLPILKETKNGYCTYIMRKQV